MTTTTIEILDSSRNLITQLGTLYPLSPGRIIQYSRELDDAGKCRFRISARDTIFSTYGNIFQPHQNHIRIKRNGTVVWQGAILDNSKRNRDYWEITAIEYLWYLGKKLVHQTSKDASGNANVYRIFNSGTMAQAVTDIMNETISDFQKYPGHPMASLTLGTVTNPNYPPNMTDGNTPPKQLTGPWNFGNGIDAPLLQFDFTAILTILKSFGIYAFADFQITNDLVFNFEPFIGNDHHYDIHFSWGQDQAGNIINYNLPLLGERMANSIVGVCATPNGDILRAPLPDQTSINKYGLLEAVAAFSDVKDQATLNARIGAELPLISQPDTGAMSVTMDEKGYPLGQYDLGDIVSINITNHGISFSDIRRIVGITIVVTDVGREFVTVQTNKPQPWQYGAS